MTTLLDLEGDVIRIPLANGKGFAIVDAGDHDLVRGMKFHLGTHGYAAYGKWAEGRTVCRTLHQLLVGHHPGMHIDHINGDRLDNRRANLRVVSAAANQVNRHKMRKGNASGVRGVGPYPSKTKPWRAQIMVDRKNIHLGLFATLAEAAEARRSAEVKFYGEECPR